MSSSVPRPFSYARIASSRYGTSSRLTMKPGRSGAVIGSLPERLREREDPAGRSRRSSSRPRITSTSFISGTGLKKCSPPNRSGRVVAAASSVMQSDDVFDRRSVCRRRRASSCRVGLALARPRFSTIASIDQIAVVSPSKPVVPDRLPSVVSRASAVTLPFGHAVVQELPDARRAPSRRSASSRPRGRSSCSRRRPTPARSRHPSSRSRAPATVLPMSIAPSNRSTLHRLDERRDTLAAADAGRGESARLPPAPQLEQERQQQARRRSCRAGGPARSRRR